MLPVASITWGGGGGVNKSFFLPFPLLSYFFDDCPVGFIQLSPVLVPLSMSRNAGRVFCDIERGTRTGLYTTDRKQCLTNDDLEMFYYVYTLYQIVCCKEVIRYWTAISSYTTDKKGVDIHPLFGKTCSRS